MASVKNKGTTSEIRIRKALFKKGYRYKVNDKSLAGSPDIVLPRYNAVIFVHGCFWHGHDNCSKAIKPNSNIKFWSAKIEKNRNRDKKAMLELKRNGWRVIVVWECEIKNGRSFDTTIYRIDKKLSQFKSTRSHLLGS
jgi:DNA mismatch endonuclease (patch repair protein)